MLNLFNRRIRQSLRSIARAKMFRFSNLRNRRCVLFLLISVIADFFCCSRQVSFSLFLSLYIEQFDVCRLSLSTYLV